MKALPWGLLVMLFAVYFIANNMGLFRFFSPSQSVSQAQVMTREQWLGAMEEKLRGMDLDSDGYISLEEGPALKDQKEPVTIEEVLQKSGHVFDEIDKNHDGVFDPKQDK